MLHRSQATRAARAPAISDATSTPRLDRRSPLVLITKIRQKHAGVLRLDRQPYPMLGKPIQVDS